MRAQIRSTKSMDLQFVVINPGYRADQLAERTERRNSMEEEKKELQPENLEQAAGGVPPIIKMRGPCPKCGKNLNNGPCGCREDSVDPRLEILKNLINQEL